MILFDDCTAPSFFISTLCGLLRFHAPPCNNFANNPFSSSEDDRRQNVNMEDMNQLNLGSRKSTTRSLSRESDDSRSCAQMQMFRPNQTDRQTHHEGLYKVFFYRFLIYPIQDSSANEKPRASQDARIVPVRIIIRS
ncbi:hypothetical protein ACS0PU_005501 [Formica fusca]